MKIFISYDLTDNPHGGGNQFLKILKKTFIEKNVYCENPEAADIILYNGHQFIQQTAHIKNKHPEKKFIHRKMCGDCQLKIKSNSLRWIYCLIRKLTFCH